jgi:hypothetical protein
MADTFQSQRAFGGGEVTKEFFGRIDDGKYQTGLALCRNFMVLPHGPAVNRPGTAYVNTVKTPAKKTRIIPFTFADDQTLIIEIGEGYFRFHTAGATVLSGGVPLEVANSYLEAELFDINYVQSADVVTLVHHNHPPAELRRLGPTSWSFVNINFAPLTTGPSSVLATAHPGATPGTPTNQSYTVTAIGMGGVDESYVPLYSTCSNNLFDDGAYNTITWTASPSPNVYYVVYKLTAGQFAYIGQTTGTSFQDDNIAADLSRTPPTATHYFEATGDYPSEVTYFDQRRVFASTDNLPQQVWMTKTGTESNFDSSLPPRDTDAIIFRAAARDGNRVRHLVPMTELIMLTASTVWRVTSINSDALTPLSVGCRPQATAGSSKVRPIVSNSSCVYVASRGGHMRELGFSFNSGGYTTADISLRAPHLFDNLTVSDMAFAAAPHPVVWAVSSNGKLIGLTYVPEEQVGAFHQHDTVHGLFESVAVVAEGNEDAVYVVVNRTINGAQTRYIERFATRQYVAQADAFYVDCGATYNGAPTLTISGLSWLEGETVSILADGAVMPRRQVVGGTITLDAEASVVQVGLPICAQLQTLPLAFQVPGYGSGRPKTIAAVHALVDESLGIFAGDAFDNLYEAKQRTTEPYGSPPSLSSGEVEIVIDGGWDDNGQVCIQQDDPLPLAILALTVDVAVGG